MSNARSARPSASTTVGISMATSWGGIVQPDSCTLYATRRLHVEVTREIVLPAERDDVWEALTDEERLSEWFANDVELDPRPGGAGVFRWENGEERRAAVEAVEPGELLVLRFEDDGLVELRLEDDAAGTRVLVRETSPQWSTALGLQALALSSCTTA
jgi:uncharacterized protein YndB with AHSA1/START domain